MTGDPNRHTKSEGLKRLLRRRGRRLKTGANTGEKVYSWAEYSQVNFTPSGDRSSLGCGVIGFLAIFALLLAPLVVGATYAIVDGKSPAEILAGSLIALLWFIFAGLCFAIPVAIIAMIYVALDGNGNEDRERLIAKADKLRERQAKTQDESANRAR